jgi:hypothetical protein
MKLYHAAFSPNSRRVRIFIAEKKITVTLVPYLAQLKYPPDSDCNQSPRNVSALKRPAVGPGVFADYEYPDDVSFAPQP